MGPAVLKATKNAMVHLDIVEAKTFGRCHCNSTSVLFHLFGKTGEFRVGSLLAARILGEK